MKLKLCLTALAVVCAAGVPANAQEMKAEVIHWWTSGGESAAVKEIAQAYRAAGGVWTDSGAEGAGNAARNARVRDGARRLGEREVLMLNMTRDEHFPLAGAVDVIKVSRVKVPRLYPSVRRPSRTPW